ncbi:MAG TPA: hypothetical protein VFK05_27730 [Polyangiaceae bacterium]|nr:hypothetical protein [Polyangiaceae bacterium]
MRRAWFLVACLAAGSVACTATTTALKGRYAKERSCSESQVLVREAGGDVYLASGCGDATQYICEGFAGFGNPSQRCRERGMNPREPVGNPPPQNTSRPDLVPPK